MAFVHWVGFEILEVDRRPDGVYVTAQEAAGKLRGDEQAAAGGGRDGMVHGVVAVRRCNRTGLNTHERVRPTNALEIDVRKILGGGAGARYDAGIVEAIGDPHARETAAQHFAGGCVK